MGTWLYDSKGRPVAFIYRGHVFSRRGRYVGQVVKDEVWNGDYVGAIVDEDMLLYEVDKNWETKDAPVPQASPGVPSPPGDRRGIGVRAGYRDVRL